MEIFMRNIPARTTNNGLKVELANILHLPPFRNPAEPLFDFNVYLFPHRKQLPTRIGSLTLPTEELGRRFLEIYGAPNAQRHVVLGSLHVLFTLSNKPVRQNILHRIRTSSFRDPRDAHEREKRAQELGALEVRLSAIQFGWESRDHVYSVEWERMGDASLSYDSTRRAFEVKTQDSTRASRAPDLFDADPFDIQSSVFSLLEAKIHQVVIRSNQIYWSSASIDQSTNKPVIFFSLQHPPAFETTSTLAESVSFFSRQRCCAFDDSHAPMAPYTSLSIRLECRSISDLHNFRQLAREVNRHLTDISYPIEHRGLFSQYLQAQYQDWVRNLPWRVAFQVEAVSRAWFVDTEELLSLRRPIGRIVDLGVDYAVALLRDFYAKARQAFWYGEANTDLPQGDTPSHSASPVRQLFVQVEACFTFRPAANSFTAGDPTAPFMCLHAVVTPTTMHLEGPYQERSNRVMRTYYRNSDSFLRVSFQDENGLQIRFEQRVDLRSFVNGRFKSILLEGLTIAGTKFEFLAYSQSALKEHAVWFVRPFEHTDETGATSVVNAASIIASLGNFHNLSFDPQLIRCPARYAARISQAFTTTDASISVDVEEILRGEDVKDASGMYCFTDGVGTISPQLAKEIWRALQERRSPRGRKDRTYPRAYQIRIQGAKGMVSVNYRLSGRTIVLRPSMIKFENVNTTAIEIAQAFDKPIPYFLNRPLIMLLEGLGVPYEVFQRLQDDAVHVAQQSVDSLGASARLLEGHGLGASFRLTSAMLGLHKLGVGPPREDPFWRQMMDFAINHVLRELKYHARIPVPGTESWTLVGVADEHGYLAEGEVFVCVDSPDESELIYLDGPVLISRSPTIHPGDVQVVHAIGRPPSGSPFVHESLRNTIVFSIRGTRPLPSYLGGGDLDGDIYNITTRRELHPPNTCSPASYAPAQRKLVDHDSTMADVAEFVAEYIISDTLGMVATRWLHIADHSTESIFDPDCLRLAELHSKAVDYPKSGQPVPLKDIPRYRFDQKPDWSAPETVREGEDSYYESSRAIGKLFRSIELPPVPEQRRRTRRQHRNDSHEPNRDEQLARVLEQFREVDPDEPDEVMLAVQEHVQDFISIEYDQETITTLWEEYSMYASQLRAICAEHTLSRERSGMLLEEEVVVGTIVAKCSQPRKRKDMMARMREQTATLVSSVKGQISGGDETPLEEWLRKAWIAYRLADIEGNAFGACSFGWIALSSIFEAIKEIENEERTSGGA